MSADAERQNAGAEGSYESDHVKVSMWTGAGKGTSVGRASVQVTDRATAEEITRTQAAAAALFASALASARDALR